MGNLTSKEFEISYGSTTCKESKISHIIDFESWSSLFDMVVLEGNLLQVGCV